MCADTSNILTSLIDMNLWIQTLPHISYSRNSRFIYLLVTVRVTYYSSSKKDKTKNYLIIMKRIIVSNANSFKLASCPNCKFYVKRELCEYDVCKCVYESENMMQLFSPKLLVPTYSVQTVPTKENL